MAKMTPGPCPALWKLLPPPAADGAHHGDPPQDLFLWLYPLDTPVIRSSEVLLARPGGRNRFTAFQKGDSDLSLRF